MKFGTGIKAGAASGAIYGLISGLIALVVTILTKDELIAKINQQISGLDIPMTAEDLYPITMMSAVPSGIIMGVLLGAILGIAFMVFHEELPKKKKGIFFAILLLIGAGIGELVSPGHGLSWLLIQTNVQWLIPFGIAAFLFFGFLLGKFYDRFK